MTAIGNASLHWLHVGLTGSNAGLDILKLENIESKDVIFSKHDDQNETAGRQGGVESYRGGWRDDQPEGEGRYTWPDGSTYEGSWMSGQKHGWGKYSWPSGASYLGEWKHGSLHGYGTFHSPDGSRYQGNWQNNLKDGIGTKWLPNGDRHEGVYVADKPHGPGRFLFASGDEFDGEFREGKFHGQGTFKWISKHRYDGEWRSGVKHGIGVFTWPDGSTYEGFWANGVQHGVGVFRPARKTTPASHISVSNVAATANAVIVGAPAAAGHVGAQLATSAFHHLADPGALLKHSLQNTGLTPPQSPHVRPGTGSTAAEVPPQAAEIPTQGARPASAPTSPTAAASAAAAATNAAKTSENMNNTSTTTTATTNNNSIPAMAASTVVYACEYRLGELILEEALKPEDLDYVFGTATHSRKVTHSGGATSTTHADKYLHPSGSKEGPYGSASGPLGPGGAWKLMGRQSLVRRRRPKKEERMGETIYKGSPSFDLMLNLQLGIRYTLTTLSKLPPLTAPLEKAHFEEKVWLRFPHQGSEVTPPHPSNDFKWKDYSPIVFRQLRTLFGISNSEYILSTCGDHALREMESPGKSGSVFFVSQDERFIIKTMRKEEIKLLLRTLPLYYAHVAAHPDTLISRFYGIHRITLASGRKVRFVVMNNIFATDMPLQKKYDLKGSTHNRTVGEIDSSTVSSSRLILKDLDLTTAFQMKKPVVERLQRQLAADAEFLQAADVMDYSLLLGVHYRNGGRGGGGGRKGAPAPNATLGGQAGHQQQQLAVSLNTNGILGSDAINRSSSGTVPPRSSEFETESFLSSPEDSENELMTPHSHIQSQFQSQSQSRPDSAASTRSTPVLGRGNGSRVNMPRRVDGGTADVAPLVIQNSLSFSAKMAKTKMQQQSQQQQQQQHSGQQPLPPQAQAPPQTLFQGGSAHAGSNTSGLTINLGTISRFIAWRRDIKEKKRQKAEQASGLGKAAMAPPPPTPAPPLLPPLPIDPLQSNNINITHPNTATHAHAIGAVPSNTQVEKHQSGGLFSSSPSPSSSSAGATAALPLFMGHRRTTSATAALGSMNSNSLFASPASFNLGVGASSSTAPSSPMVGVQRPGSGPVFNRTASARGGTTASTTGQHHRKENNIKNTNHLRLTYSEQLIEQHAALVASLASWGVDNKTNNITALQTEATTTAAAVGAVSAAANTRGEEKSTTQAEYNNSTIDITTTTTPTKLIPSRSIVTDTDENTAVNNSTNEQIEVGQSTPAAVINYRADAAALPIDSSIAEPTTPSSARVSNVFTRNRSATHTTGGVFTGGEVFVTPFTMQSPRQHDSDAAGGAAAGGASASPFNKNEEISNNSMIEELDSMSYSEGIDGLSDDEAQAMVSRLTTRLSKPIEERLAFDLLRLARHRMLGASSSRGGNGTASSRLPTAVLAAARHSRLHGTNSLDRKAFSGTAALTPVAESAAAAGSRPPPQQQQVDAADDDQMEHAESLSRHLAAIAVPLDPTPGILSAHTVPSTSSTDPSSTAAESDQDVALFLGVIDWLQPYNARKRLEHGFKSVILDSRAISVCEPRAYAKRFLKLMSRLFVSEPEVGAPVGE